MMDKELMDMKGRLRAFSEGDSESLPDLVSRYLQTTAEHLEELEKAMSAGDAAGVERAAHSASGPCEMFGAASLSRLLRGLEKTASRRELRGSHASLEKIRAEFLRVKERLGEPLAWAR